jgi:hypothetical protein
MPGLYRSVMAFGLIAVVSVLVVYLVALVSIYIAIQSPAAQALISVLQNLAAILGTALATVVAFYFGIRGVEPLQIKPLQQLDLSLQVPVHRHLHRLVPPLHPRNVQTVLDSIHTIPGFKASKKLIA